MTKKLEILLLGPPVVRWNCDLISIQRRVPRALLFYLAWQGTMVARETILDLFWEVDLKSAKARLTETISRLKSSLPVDDIILNHNGLVGLNLDKVFIDRLYFENLIDELGRIPWQIPDNEPLTTDLYFKLTQANDLWRDRLAMQGLYLPTPELDHWLQQSSELLQNTRFNVLKRLSDHAFTMLDFQNALNFARTAIEYDPFNQDIQFRIFRSMVKLGQLSGARQYFESTREMMLRELGINPSPEMINVYKELRNLDDTPLPDIEPHWEIHPTVEIPFVGRENAFCKISQILEKKHGLLIIGESGQGKSRLIQEYTARLHPQPRILLAVCRPMERSLPFNPIVELLRRHVTPDEWLQLSPIWATYLVSLLPELTQIRQDLKLYSLLEDSNQAQVMIFESIRQVFLLMNTHHPIFLVIDDAHWADEATLSTLAYILVRTPFSNTASLALIARTEDISSSLQMMLESIQQSKHATIYPLGNLQRDAIENLANHLFKIQPSEQFISNLIADTGGNTFFVLEILRAIIEAGLDVQDLDINLPSTENLQNLILTRIHTIQPKSREIIEIAALIGSDFSIKVLEKASQKSTEEISIILDELEGKLIILPSDQQKGELFYRFVHDKIRETLARKIPPARAQLLHQRIIASLPENQAQAAVLAQHYRGAGDLVSTFRYWIKAAEQARKLFAKEDAAKNYAQAEIALQQIESELNDLEIYRFYNDWNDLAYNISDTNLLKHIGYQLIRLGENRNNHLLIGAGLDALGDASMTINDFEAGLAYTNQAISHLEENNCFELVEAFNHRGTFLYMLNRLEEALVSFQDALALSTELNDPKINKALSNAHYQIALLQILFGKPVIGFEHGLKALAYGEELQHTYSIAQAYSILALSQFYRGEFTQARETAQKGIILAERIHGWRMLGYLNSYAAMAEIALGYLDSAYSHANKAVEIGQEYEQLDVSALGFRCLGEIHRLLYDFPTAVTFHQNGFASVPENFLGFDNLYRLGLAQHYQGNPNGLDQIKMSHTLLEEYSVAIGVLTAQVCSALVYADNEDWDATENLATGIAKFTKDRGMKNFHIIAKILLGQVNLSRGNLPIAFDHFQTAIQEAQFIQNPWLEIKAQAALQQVYQRQGNPATQPGLRIEDLLQQIEKQISSPSLIEPYKVFHQQISQRTRISTDIL